MKVAVPFESGQKYNLRVASVHDLLELAVQLKQMGHFAFASCQREESAHFENKVLLLHSDPLNRMSSFCQQKASMLSMVFLCHGGRFDANGQPRPESHIGAGKHLMTLCQSRHFFVEGLVDFPDSDAPSYSPRDFLHACGLVFNVHLAAVSFCLPLSFFTTLVCFQLHRKIGSQQSINEGGTLPANGD
jgi:hypothetical protein